MGTRLARGRNFEGKGQRGNKWGRISLPFCRASWLGMTFDNGADLRLKAGPCATFLKCR